MTLREFKALALECAVFQTGPDDVTGFRADRDWQDELRSARSWEAVREALPTEHPMTTDIPSDK